MIVDDNAHGDSNALASSALGPFYRAESPLTALGGVIGRPGIDGDPLFVSFDLVDGEGAPIANALVDIWLADRHGFYENQRSEEHKSELQSLMRISYAVFCLKKKIDIKH